MSVSDVSLLICNKSRIKSPRVRDNLSVKTDCVNEELMIQYLLGELSEQDCLDFEQATLDRDQLFEELLAVEAELTDDYVRGLLVGRKRKEFEKRMLNSPDRLDQLELGRLITRRTSD